MANGPRGKHIKDIFFNFYVIIISLHLRSILISRKFQNLYSTFNTVHLITMLSSWYTVFDSSRRMELKCLPKHCKTKIYTAYFKAQIVWLQLLCSWVKVGEHVSQPYEVFAIQGLHEIFWNFTPPPQIYLQKILTFPFIPAPNRPLAAIQIFRDYL